MQTELRGHERIDQRSIALHRAIAERLRANPALLETARQNIARWAPTAGRSGHYLDAWREVLDRPRERWAIYDLFPMERK